MTGRRRCSGPRAPPATQSVTATTILVGATRIVTATRRFGSAGKRQEYWPFRVELVRNASCPIATHAMSTGVSRYRTLIEWTLSGLALTTIVVVMLSVDSPVRQYATVMVGDVKHSAVAMKVPEPVARVSRNAWRLCMDHKPLAGFAGVAVVLVLFMRRMR
jgi:hypothetical protein